MWHRRIALTLAAAAVTLLVLSGLGVRAGAWPFRVGFGMFAGSLFLGLGAAGTAAVALVIPRLRAGAVLPLVIAFLLGVASAAVPLDTVRRVKTLPYINDITTDTDNPPQFSLAKEYPVHFGELQQIGYPEVRPLLLAVPPKQAFARAIDTARAMGLEVTVVDEKAGRFEAVATTLWFGFKDDIAIRVTAAGDGSRIDMRSRSRVGRSDVGTNAKRIREFFAAVRTAR